MRTPPSLSRLPLFSSVTALLGTVWGLLINKVVSCHVLTVCGIHFRLSWWKAWRSRHGRSCDFWLAECVCETVCDSEWLLVSVEVEQSVSPMCLPFKKKYFIFYFLFICIFIPQSVHHGFDSATRTNQSLYQVQFSIWRVCELKTIIFFNGKHVGTKDNYCVPLKHVITSIKSVQCISAVSAPSADQ